jgi:lysophospholipase L1-like esterase
LPTRTPDWFRNRLADDFVLRWGLQAPSFRWRNADPFSGESFEPISGDFANCAKYGARTDDLLLDPHRQLETCMPEEERSKRTLVIMTIGGNDIYSLLEDSNAGVDEATMRATYTRATALFEDAIRWIVEPGRFPNGVWVIFSTTYDFTDQDGALDMASCDGAQLINMDEALLNPVIWDIMSDAQESYVRLATETGTDLIFLGEQFCGHGWNAADPTSRCYRGPGAAIWTDLTCEHPNRAGHEALTDMVRAVIEE